MAKRGASRQRAGSGAGRQQRGKSSPPTPKPRRLSGGPKHIGNSGAPRTGLPPLLPDSPIRALILGSFPSVESMRRRQYYGNPRNWFWRVMEACGVVPDAMGRYEDRVAAMLDHGIAVWDLYLNVEREGSGDSEIVSRVPNDLRMLWDRRGPFPILLNGYRIPEWRRYFNALPVQPTALPSTSPRPTHWNTAESRRDAIGAWQRAIADLETRASEPDA